MTPDVALEVIELLLKVAKMHARLNVRQKAIVAESASRIVALLPV